MVWFWLPIWINWKSCDLCFKVWILFYVIITVFFFVVLGGARGIVIVRGVSIVWVWFLPIWKKEKEKAVTHLEKWKNEKAVIFIIKIEFWSWFWFFFFFGMTVTGEKWRRFCYMVLYMLRSMKWISLKVEVAATFSLRWIIWYCSFSLFFDWSVIFIFIFNGDMSVFYLDLDY